MFNNTVCALFVFFLISSHPIFYKLLATPVFQKAFYIKSEG